jgi:hypothetical protein
VKIILLLRSSHRVHRRLQETLSCSALHSTPKKNETHTTPHSQHLTTPLHPISTSNRQEHPSRE